MDIGLVKETRPGEARVALTPYAVHSLAADGHRVYVQSGAGAGAGFSDEEYQSSGAHVVYSREESIRRAELVAMVAAPRLEECALFGEDQTIYAFLLLAAQPRSVLEALVARRITAIGMEMIGDGAGRVPIQHAMSEIGGPLSVQMAARLLQTPESGRGILLGGISGVAPAHVVILGGGAVGWTATRSALGLGAQVTVFDTSPDVLHRIQDHFGGRAVTRFVHHPLLERTLPTADVLIAAAAVHGARAPELIARSQVRAMKPGAVIVDVAIDAGGCVETSRPTTIEQPTYLEEQVIHCCVPNLPALVARTASYVLANASLPYLRGIAAVGAQSAAAADPDIAAGVCIDRGEPKMPGLGPTGVPSKVGGAI